MQIKNKINKIMNIQNECHEYIENILGCKTDLTVDETLEVLYDLLVRERKRKY